MNNKFVDLNDRDVGAVEQPVLDVKQYIGNRVKIGDVNVLEGLHGYYLKVISEKVATIGEGEKAWDLTASKIYSLITLEDGKVGWSDKGALAVFLKSVNKNHYKELGKRFNGVEENTDGVEVVVQSTISKKDGKEYLTF